MKKVFICSRLRADTEKEVEENKQHARFWCKQAIRAGYAPFAPHLLYTQFLDDSVEVERENGIVAGIEFLKSCDKMWVCEADCMISEGMRKEIAFCEEHGIPVVYKMKNRRLS